ncbi:MAG: DMT family transporter [Bdellovibrionota bacterium]|nr:DMT family transporter [Bdellovibrionota bacterium]
MINSKKFVLFVLVCIQILFGINFAASKIIVAKMNPILWSDVRFLLAGIIMLIVTLIMRRPHPPITKDFFIPISILSILGMALGQGLFLVGLKYTTSINSAIILTMIPILTLMVVVLRKQEDLTFNKFIGFVLSFFGVLLMRNVSDFQMGGETLLGDFLVLGGAFCFALYISFGKKYFMKFDNMWTTTWMFLISGVAMLVPNISKLGELTDQTYDSIFLAAAAYSIIGATLLTYFLNNWALKRAASGHVAIFIYLQPVVAGVIGYIFLEEPVTFRMGICSILILTGLLFSLSKNN